MKTSKADVARQFGKQSHLYASSASHSGGSDLELLVRSLNLAADMELLDVATGAGHTAAAVAPFVKGVTAIDLAPEMIAETEALARSRGLTNVRAMVMDSEELTFHDASFDVVTSRIAPHHFLDLPAALGEIARVLRVGGRFGLEDSCAPADRGLDRFINHVETLRDETHIRSHNEREWRAMLEKSGFEIEQSSFHRTTHNVREWIERSGIDEEAAARVYAAFSGASKAARDYFEIEYEGRATRFTDDKVIFIALRA